MTQRKRVGTATQKRRRSAHIYKRLRGAAPNSRNVSDFDTLKDFYAFPVELKSRIEILSYIAEHRYLVSFLIDAAEAVKSHFAHHNSEPLLKVELLNDKLSVRVAAECTDIEVEACLDNFYHQWLSNALFVLGTTDFIPD